MEVIGTTIVAQKEANEEIIPMIEVAEPENFSLIDDE